MLGRCEHRAGSFMLSRAALHLIQSLQPHFTEQTGSFRRSSSPSTVTQLVSDGAQSCLQNGPTPEPHSFLVPHGNLNPNSQARPGRKEATPSFSLLGEDVRHTRAAPT